MTGLAVHILTSMCEHRLCRIFASLDVFLRFRVTRSLLYLRQGINVFDACFCFRHNFVRVLSWILEFLHWINLSTAFWTFDKEIRSMLFALWTRGRWLRDCLSLSFTTKTHEGRFQSYLCAWILTDFWIWCSVCSFENDVISDPMPNECQLGRTKNLVELEIRNWAFEGNTKLQYRYKIITHYWRTELDTGCTLLSSSKKS